MITRGNSFKFRSHYILEDTKLTILIRQERERLVLELYNQGKTYREIAKEARISPCDIGIILNKATAKKKIEESKEEQDNNAAEKNQNQEQKEPQLFLPAQTYKLFSDRKTPLEVAIALNLRESEQQNSTKNIGN